MFSKIFSCEKVLNSWLKDYETIWGEEPDVKFVNYQYAMTSVIAKDSRNYQHQIDNSDHRIMIMVSGEQYPGVKTPGMTRYNLINKRNRTMFYENIRAISLEGARRVLETRDKFRGISEDHYSIEEFKEDKSEVLV